MKCIPKIILIFDDIAISKNRVWVRVLRLKTKSVLFLIARLDKIEH